VVQDNRGIDVVHTYNGILFQQHKESYEHSSKVAIGRTICSLKH
jgi:hypothetical protein